MSGLLPVVPLNIFQDALGVPFCDDRAECRLGYQVVLPGWVVPKSGALGRGGDFWHDKLAADDDAGDAVQCAELCVPGFLGLY